MSISSVGGSSGWSASALHMQRRQPPDMSKDQLTELQSKLKSEGKDTANLDKVIENFDKLDSSGDGKVSFEELKTGAEKLGITLPQKGGHGGPQGPDGGPPPPPPDLTKDQLSQISEQLKADGKDTDNLDKIIDNFDQLDANGDGKVGFDELKTGAEKLGIKLPERQGGPPPAWGPPPGLVSDSDSDDSSKSGSCSNGNSRMSQMLQSFSKSDPFWEDLATSSVNVAA